ncbi:hypothetical protein JOD57_004404 [Geodermatophilus bullaregiensis]|nr:hypothetical protein [Geodermatophilus bullaregiensis]
MEVSTTACGVVVTVLSAAGSVAQASAVEGWDQRP